MPWIGATTLRSDIEQMMRSACYDKQDDPNEPIGHNAYCEYLDAKVPADPHCKRCKSQMRRKMRSRGLTDQEIRNLFSKVGAEWHWDQDREKRAQSDRPKPPSKAQIERARPKHYVVGSNIAWVKGDQLTPDQVEANERHDQAWEDMIQGRTDMIDKGATPDEAAAAFPMPKSTIYRVSPE